MTPDIAVAAVAVLLGGSGLGGLVGYAIKHGRAHQQIEDRLAITADTQESLGLKLDAIQRDLTATHQAVAEILVELKKRKPGQGLNGLESVN